VRPLWEGIAVKLSKIWRRYRECAYDYCKQSPEQLGIMPLTLGDITSMIDKIAVKLRSILESFDPESIPPGYLSPLILKSRAELMRPIKLLRYFDERRRKADPKNPSYFGPISDRSFAVQYYNQSTDLQELLLEIQSQVSKDRDAKIQELEIKSKELPRRQAQYEKMRHWTYTGHHGNDEKKKCRPRCPACKFRQTYLMIHSFEWPIPTILNEMKVVLFELRLDPVFSALREVLTNPLDWTCQA